MSNFPGALRGVLADQEWHCMMTDEELDTVAEVLKASASIGVGVAPLVAKLEYACRPRGPWPLDAAKLYSLLDGDAKDEELGGFPVVSIWDRTISGRYGHPVRLIVTPYEGPTYDYAVDVEVKGDAYDSRSIRYGDDGSIAKMQVRRKTYHRDAQAKVIASALVKYGDEIRQTV